MTICTGVKFVAKIAKIAKIFIPHSFRSKIQSFNNKLELEQELTKKYLAIFEKIAKIAKIAKLLKLLKLLKFLFRIVSDQKYNHLITN